VITKKLKGGPLPTEVIVAQIHRDAVKPRTDISGNPRMMAQTLEAHFLGNILGIVQMTEQPPGCTQDSLFVITHDGVEIRHK